jgi:LysM repeat protein
MPVGCGTWPAFWMFGPDWPNGGEIDIIEGVNDQSTDSITLHTSPGCVVSNANSQPGTFTVTSDCSTSNSNVGCSVGTGNSNNFGTGFNAVGGGTYAMQWAGSGIYVWFWERGTVPDEVTSNPPNVAAWGQPLATFTGDGCDFNTYFSEQNLIFDTTFCGAWAGAVWGQGQCAGLADTCSDYVANNPAAFTGAYWLINSIQVYQLQPSGPPQNTYNPPPPPPPPPAPTPAPVQTQTSGSTYTIQAGDTFWSISIEFGTTVAALEAANPSLDPNDLQIGEVISIP